MSDFFGAYLKIERADQHIRDLEGIISQFATREPHKMVTEFDSASRLTKVRFEASESLPKQVSLIFGYAIGGRVEARTNMNQPS